MEVTSSWYAHDFEPWIAAFDCWQPSTVWTGQYECNSFLLAAMLISLTFTGGDDCKLKGWDLRQGCDEPIFVNKR